MFKLFERDKCITVQLDMSDTDVINTIEPGTLLFDDANGVRPATTGDDFGPANSGSFYLSADYYANTMNASHAATAIAPSSSITKGTGKLAAIPLMENFTAVIETEIDVSKGDLLTITDGAFAVADEGKHVAAVATEDNNNSTEDLVDTKISTFIYRHEVATEE